MTEPDRRDRLMLGRSEGIGPISFRRLLLRYGTAAAALAALPGLAARSGNARFAAPSADTIERELAALRKRGGRMLVLGEPDYPAVLADLPDAPVGIAVLGDVALLSRRAVAVVGSRNASINGLRMAEQISADLAAAGLVVVSGLARGIDTAAHQGAMVAGKTVAVVAGRRRYRLSAGECRFAAPDWFARCGCFRGAARQRALGAAFPPPQPDHCRAGARRGRG